MPNQSPNNPSKLPPQNEEAETATLGCLMLDKDAIVNVADTLSPDDFYDSRHRHVYEAMLELFGKNVSIDTLTVSNQLEEKKILEQIGGASYLTQLVNSVPSAAHVVYYASIVRKKGTLRRLIRSATEITSLAFAEEGDVESILDKAEQKLFGISQQHLKQNFVPISSVLHETFERIDELHREKGKLRGVASGFVDLDHLLGGLQKSDLIILAARPSMGKTALALDIIRHISVNLKIPTGIFSLEMSKDQLVDRLLSAQSDVNLWKIRTGNLNDDDFEKIGEAMGRLSEAPIFIDDAAGCNIMEIRTKARRLQAENDIGLIVVDYLQLMAGRNQDNRVQEVSEISRSLKILARELNVPVLALSQLSRNVENRPDKVPQLADLRESGCLAGDSLVTTADSGQQVPIRDLVGKSGFKVWALNEQTMRLEKAVVSRVFSTGTKKVFKLTTRLGREIRATGNHKFRTISGWKRLDELEMSDHVALPRIIPSPETQTMSDDELALLGHLIGDGCTLPNHAIQYTTRELDLAETVKNLAINVFGEEVAPRINPERNWYQVYLASTRRHTHSVRSAVTEWLMDLSCYGLRSYEKIIPKKVFQQPELAIALFLRHLWSTDGCINDRKKSYGNRVPYPTIYYASSSEVLARGVQSLLLRLGINAWLRKRSQGTKGRDQYHVVVTGKPDMARFVVMIGAVGSYKQKSLGQIEQYLLAHEGRTNRDIIPHYVWRQAVVPAMQAVGMTARQMSAGINMSYMGTTIYKQNMSRERLTRVALAVKSEPLIKLADSDVYWDQIMSIKEDGDTEVYDLTVEKHHNFIANSVIVHNSIEQDADVVAFIYREDMYKGKDSARPNVAEIHIKKHRNGPTGEVDLFFDPDHTTFRNLDQQFNMSPDVVMQSLNEENPVV